MMELRGEGITGEEEIFQKPMFQTFGMFVGMMFGLVMHWAVLFFKLPFPGYPAFDQFRENKGDLKETNTTNYGSITNGKIETDPLIRKENGPEDPPELPTWMYFFLAIPSIFDLGATALCMVGLQYIDVSIYQLLRGSGLSPKLNL